MKLFLISQSANNGYDTYDSAVVCAETEDEARLTHPNGKDEWDDHSWCSSPSQVKVTIIGEAAKRVSRGVVLASFNAG
jgi:hypothetical protein